MHLLPTPIHCLKASVHMYHPYFSRPGTQLILPFVLEFLGWSAWAGTEWDSLRLVMKINLSCIFTQRALLKKSVITTKELAILALLNSDPEDSSDEDCRPSNHCTPTKHNCTPTKHSPLKAEGYYCDSSDSEISVTTISPVKERVKGSVGASCDGAVLGEVSVWNIPTLLSLLSSLSLSLSLWYHLHIPSKYKLHKLNQFPIITIIYRA